MRLDPFAPANSPHHPSNAAPAFHPKNGDPAADHRAELLDRYLTSHEYDLTDVGDLPRTEELERRQTLVDEYREQLATEGPDAEPPTIEDVTGELYRWREGDRTEDDPNEPSGQPDGETSSAWVHVPADDATAPPGPEAPPRNGPGSDTDTWRAYAAETTNTPASDWATMTRTEIITKLEQDGVISSEQA